VLAHLVGFLGDFDVAEEACQEAFAIAAERWPRTGMPPNPGAWLTVTARNRAIDRIRRERTLAEKTRQLEIPETVADDMDELEDITIEDERLELIFCCCHPALSLEAQVALTLRAGGGLETEEIAHALLTSPETMKRRLTRAKAKIKASGADTLVLFATPTPTIQAYVIATKLGYKPTTVITNSVSATDPFLTIAEKSGSNIVEGTISVKSRSKTIETRKIKIESTTGATRIITTGMTTKIAPGGSTRRNTTGPPRNSRRRTTRSSRNTGIGAMLIRITTS